MISRQFVHSAIALRASRRHRQIWDRFQQMLQRKQKSRITVNSDLKCHQELVGKFTGVFVALGIDSKTSNY